MWFRVICLTQHLTYCNYVSHFSPIIATPLFVQITTFCNCNFQCRSPDVLFKIRNQVTLKFLIKNTHTFHDPPCFHPIPNFYPQIFKVLSHFSDQQRDKIRILILPCSTLTSTTTSIGVEFRIDFVSTTTDPPPTRLEVEL